MKWLEIPLRDGALRLDADGLTARMAREFRRVTGHGALAVIYPDEGWDIDTIAELVWLYELQTGGPRSLDDIADVITYRDVRVPVWVDEDEATAKSEPLDPKVAEIVAEVRTDPET